jgi:hypothetical protein
MSKRIMNNPNKEEFVLSEVHYWYDFYRRNVREQLKQYKC